MDQELHNWTVALLLNSFSETATNVMYKYFFKKMHVFSCRLNEEKTLN